MRAVRIANCSGFYGDRFAAPAEMLAGPDPIDVLTGDYLAELTMLILWKARQKDPKAGYANTFVRQMEQVLGTCLDRGVRVVTNAGGLNPTGLADRLGELADRLGLRPRIAVITGDDLTGELAALQAAGETFEHLDTGVTLADAGVVPATANAYLGGWGIATALAGDADVVICPRVTDASLVVGPAAWWHGWQVGDWDALAGAVVAGHIIECGPQATGGNYSLVQEVPNGRYPGFPIAEVAADGSSVITKQPGTGGAVTVGTVTAQLLYEIAEPAYANPDVVARFDTITVSQDGPDRVRVSGVRGEPAPQRLKVALTYAGGYRNTMTMVLTGLDIEAKATATEAMLWELLGGKERFAAVDVQLVRTDRPDAPSNEQATAQLRVTVKDPDPKLAGRTFSGAVTELALASYAGFFTLAPPGDASAFGVYWPALVERRCVDHSVTLPGGAVVGAPSPEGPAGPPIPPAAAPVMFPEGAVVSAPLGTVCGARSGDKGGNANVGVWTWDDDAYAWLWHYLTVDRVRELIPEARLLRVDRYELPNLRALNFVIVGILGEGVASSVRFDPQAKGLGEYLRSRLADIPVALIERLGR
jgi:hypothetical protein